MSAMAPVFFKHALSGFIQEHELDSGGADVNTGMTKLHKQSPAEYSLARGKSIKKKLSISEYTQLLYHDCEKSFCCSRKYYSNFHQNNVKLI